jgi:TPR repeat protein
MRKGVQDKVKTVLRIVAPLLLCHACAVFAAPEDGYRSGMDAYRAGDVVKAMALLRPSADAGHARSQSLLAYILNQAEFNDEAVAYYRKAAAQGEPDGEYGLGSLYAAGEGVKRDPAEARKWITRAAEHGHAAAINSLAQAYMDGELGIDETQRNGAEALRWMRRAAELGYGPALERLAAAYRKGAYGLGVDLKQADALDAQARAAKGVVERSAARKKERK